MSTNIRELAEQYNDYIIERRRYYHSCPELSGQEIHTTEALKADLEAMGVEVELCKTCHGLVGTIKGGKPGKAVVALRSDTDALPVEEKTGLPFASENPGVMHACGHDNHMAMLLGAAKILTTIRDEIPGTVKLLFQPAEETAQGAKAMIAEGVLKGVDAHLWRPYLGRFRCAVYRCIRRQPYGLLRYLPHHSGGQLHPWQYPASGHRCHRGSRFHHHEHPDLCLPEQ